MKGNDESVMIPDVPSICCDHPSPPAPHKPSISLTQALFLQGLALPPLLDMVLALVSADAGTLSGLE